MTKKEYNARLEVLRLTALCRLASKEIRELDEIIQRRHPRYGGTTEKFLSELDGKIGSDYIDKFVDLLEQKQKLQRVYDLTRPAQSYNNFPDLEI